MSNANTSCFMDLSHATYDGSRRPSIRNVDVKEDFLRLGWCPHQINRLHSVHSPQVLAYLSTLDRRNYRPSNHQACTDSSRCVANNVNLKQYDTAHTASCSGSCQAFGVDYTEIVSIIRSGGVPLVAIHIDPASTPEKPVIELRVTARTNSSRYTALSHVWFDGLGNPSANALPACQLLSISSRLISQPREHESGMVRLGALQVDWLRQSFILHPEQQPPLFWMDTLCIPVGDAEREVRLTAINQMASIYAAAVQVLVLDAELMKCETGASTSTEILARIACSAWMTRSWTLQEGVLALECVFQFKDRAIDPIHEWCHHGSRFGNPSSGASEVFPDADDAEGWEVYKEIYDHFWDTLHQDWKSKYRKDPPTPGAYKQSGGAAFSIGSFRGSQAVGRVQTLPAAQGLTKRGKGGLDDKDHFTLDFGDERRLKQLVDTWNELAHRSTTMPEDLHVIIANLLDFNADTIMDIDTRAERMRAMLLSFKLLPVSLFWNTGPRWGDDDASYNGCNRWVPVEPSKSNMTMTPVMEVSQDWLRPDFEIGVEDGNRRAQVLRLHGTIDPDKTQCMIASPHAAATYEMSLLGTQVVPLKLADEHCIITEESLPISCDVTVRGALFNVLSNADDTMKDELRLKYCCPIILNRTTDDNDFLSNAITIDFVPDNTTVLVKYDHIPDFTPYPRRPWRGATLQGTLPMLLLGSIAATASFACFVAFVATIAQPLHKFGTRARGFLIAWITIWLGAITLCFAWGGFITPVLNRMALASYDKGWQGEHRGWWGKYVKVERALARAEHRTYIWAKGLYNKVILTRRPRGQDDAEDPGSA